ncbi:uncharacterized protein F5Z01DRAFT_672180 [Emericellopsis atlantica]|uniref:Uncharacterized protein n=1 Tax=Emericellopsis atlantica TaxID=2614577 RepID=A0A9P8CRH7_9HYPO|nr:uncharacterized protein F5Z01DRAFT_672180 [Emericellopsis atlantica]KAG9256185.1 hypothetical protein F5Z01DRAFT_672180 [Emericellopsis atlantica]
MKAAVVLSFVAAAMAGLVEKRGCNANNCARQVTGTRAGLTPIESRKADCSSFMTATVMPDAETTTVTVTVDADEPAKFKREAAALEYRAETVLPTDIPAYASSCDDPPEYSSVCSCWGITSAVTTAPTPTETKTVTTTVDYCEDL